MTRYIFINNTPSFSYAPRIEFERGNIKMGESETVYIEAKYNFVDEDESSPSLFWKLNRYHLSKSELDKEKIPFNGTRNQVGA